MGKRKWIIAASIVLSIILITMAGVYIYYQIAPYCCKYDLTVEKSYNTSFELQAINASENLDIAEIFEIGRYSDRGEYYSDPPKSKTAYVWPNIIDNISLTYYREKIERLNESKTKVISKYSYYAKCEHIMDYSIGVHQMNILLNTTKLNDFSRCAIMIDENLTLVTEYSEDVSISNISGYYIEQFFRYEESYGTLAGFGGEVKQIIILNEEFQLITFISEYVGGWIA